MSLIMKSLGKEVELEQFSKPLIDMEIENERM